MRVRVADIREEGLALAFTEKAEDFPVLKALMERGECVFTLPVNVRLRLVPMGGLVEVAGHVATQVEMACGRCLKPSSIPVASAFELAYARELPEIEDESDEGYELTAEDLGLVLYTGEEIDFADVVQEQVVLALPCHPLCDKECRGLCPRCGADLNEAKCHCEPQNFNIKFAALKNLKLDE